MTILKSVVVCLALANVGYFLWSRGIAAPPDAPLAAAPATMLKLVSEVPPAARAPTAEPAAATAPSSASAAEPAGDAETAGLLTVVKRCLTVGPFRDVAEASHAASTLRSGGYDPRQRVVDGDLWAGVWVYLPIPPTPGAIDPLIAKLRAAGFDEALEMPGPADASVISLGLFNDPKRAQARVAQAHTLGYSPQVVDRKRSGSVYWVDIDLKPTDGLLNPADLQGDTGRMSRLEIKACPAAPAVPQ